MIKAGVTNTPHRRRGQSGSDVFEVHLRDTSMIRELRDRGRWSMIRKSGNRFSLATNAERVCAEIMLKQKELERDDVSI
jgi:hypothetical protein